MEGYEKLGKLMGDHPEYAILRRFGSLNAENLLYLQAEIHHLEISLREQQRGDRTSEDSNRRFYTRDWCSLKECGEAEVDENKITQWSLILQIREKIKEYNAALLQSSAVIRLGQPKQDSVKFLQIWMDRPSMGNLRLLGQDCDIWAKTDIHDMVSLSPTREDLFTHWISTSAITWFHQHVGRRWLKSEKAEHLTNTIVYPAPLLFRIARLFTIVLACALPILAIFILYFVDTMSKRLGVVGTLTAVFAFCMALATDSGMGVIFSATAAFAAVQVVFVSTSPN